MQAKVYNLAGEEVRSIELEDAIFGITPNVPVIHQAVLRQQANARQGTHNTRTRAHVSGGGRKPWRQKGTGRARQGSTRSPQWTHGGVVFGPHTRSYEQDMPRKMRRLAIRSVLSAKARDGELVLVESFADLEPRTKAMAQALKALNIGEKSALIFTTGETNLAQAASNLPKVKTLSAHLLSVVDMLKYDYLVLPLPSLDVVRGILSNQGGRTRRPLDGVEQDGASDTATETTSTTIASAPAATTATTTPTEDNVTFAPTATVQATAQETTTGTASAADTTGDTESTVVVSTPDTEPGTEDSADAANIADSAEDTTEGSEA